MKALKKIPQHNFCYEQNVADDMRSFLDWNKIKVSEDLNPADVLKQALDLGFNHVCQESHPYFADDLTTSARMLSDKKLFERFPCATILSTTDVNEEKEKQLLLVDLVFTEAKQKSNALNHLETGLFLQGMPATLVTDVLVIADELFTNAVFNAPFVDLENNSPGAQRDDTTIKMDSNKLGRLFIGMNESRIVVGCRDNYGSLNLMKLFRRIKNCYDTNVADNMNMTTRGGAGIGSFIVFNSCSSYYAIVEEGKFTMICCSLPRKMSGKIRSQSPKNLHFIMQE